MMRINLKTFMEVDPAQKGYEWASLLVTQMRRYMIPLVKERTYRDNMDLLEGNYDMKNEVALFKDPVNAGVSFIPISVMEKIVNTLIAEVENSGIHISLEATDPTAVNQKQKDRDLIANRKPIEATLSHLRQSIGLPEFSLKGHKNEDGKPLFSGNIDTFDQLGLDENSSEDLDYFFSTFYRLRHEIKGEEAIRAYIKLSEVAENIGLWMRDILAVKAIASRTYVNESTGAIESGKYVRPDQVYVLPGKRRDYNDAQAKEVREEVTVSEMIYQIGNEFDYEKHMPLLLQAANTTGDTGYSGVWDGEDFCFGDRQAVNNWCLYEDFLELKVVLCYIEWKSWDAAAYKVIERNRAGNFNMYPMDVGKEVPKNAQYVKEAWYYQTTYRAYYFLVSEERTLLFRYGKLCMMPVEGANDEYSGFSISCYREKGKPAVKVAEPYMRLLQKAWVKFEHLVAKAKPPGRAYSYDSLVRIAQEMFPELGENMEAGIARVLKLVSEGENEIYTYPQTDDGKVIGGGGQSSYEIKNGLSESAKEFMGVVQYCFTEIDDKIGISRLRDGDPNPRESFKAADAATQSSMNSTQYMRSMLINMLNNVGKRILGYVQDIVRFKDKATLPYKHLLTMLGDETMQDFESLSEFAFHRYGIFVEAVNTAFQKQAVLGQAQDALNNKLISYEQFTLISNIETPKAIGRALAYERKRTERMAKQAAQEDKKHAVEMEREKNAGIAAKSRAEAEGKVAVANVSGQWQYKIALLNHNKETQKQDMKGQNSLQLVDNKSQAKQQEQANQQNIDAQASLLPS